MVIVSKSIKTKTILFGVGAESDFFACGSNFINKVLGIECKGWDKNKITDINNSIATYIKDKIKYNQIFYPNFVKESNTFDIDSLYEICLRNYYLNRGKSKDKIDKIIKNDKNKNKSSKKKFIREHPSYLGLLDSYFYTIIQPKSFGQKNFLRVIMCYYRAYLALVDAFLKENKFDTQYILNHPTEIYKLIEDKCINIIKNDKNCYFSILNKNHDLNYVTTNYTPFGKVLSNDCCYLHGKFNLFESAYSRNIIDVNSKELPSDDLYFPYIFIQSGIKPIKERNEIIEYKRFIDY